MWKTEHSEKRSSGLSLSELVIVMGVTMVLTAILMPAIAGMDPERAENILISASVPEVIQVPNRPQVDPEQYDRLDRRANRANSVAVPEVEGELPLADTAAPLTPSREVEGMGKMITTDIRYRLP